jgi:predicted permease
MNDVRYAWRLLRRDVRYAAVAILTMMIGIGSTTTLFSVAYGVLLKPLPWADSDRLMRLTESRKGQQARLPGTISNGAYLAWRDQASTADAIGGYGLGGNGMTAAANGGEPARLQVARLTASMFDVLRVRPLRGRAFTADDERDTGGPYPMPTVLIVSYGLWQEWFGGREDAIGSVVRLDDQPVTIVGIMPRDFTFPDRETRAWLPMPVGSVLAANGVRRIQIFYAMARLKPAVTPQQAAAEATVRARTAPDPGFAAVAMFGSDAPSDVTVTPAIDAMTAEVRPALVLLLAAVSLLLATATANVGGLQLARAVTRRRELLVRAALGAAQRALVKQLIVESALIGGIGAIAGVILAVATQRMLRTLLPADFPRAADIAVNVPVVLFAVVVAIVTSVVCGLMPAASTRRLDLTSALADAGASSRVGGSGSGWTRLRGVVMAAQLAFACLLLVGAALLTRSFVALMHADRGYDPANVLSARLDLPPQQSDGRRHLALSDTVLARMRGEAGVRTAAAADALPFLSLGSALGTEMPSPSNPAVKQQVRANLRMVSPEYFAALRLRLIEGRLLSDAEGPATRPAVVVSRTFARQYLGQQPLGKLVPLRSGRIRAGAEAEVVGVVDDLRQTSVTESAGADLFISYRQFPDWWTRGSIIFVIRTTDDPLAHVQALRTALREQDPNVALDSIMTMEERVANSLAKPRLYAVLFVFFAAAALAIAAVGLFGLLSYLVAQRSREIGIRTALGAQASDIVALVLRQGTVIGICGMATGLWAAYVLTRYLSSFLYGVGRTDPPSYMTVAFAVGVVATLASVIPAWRAARIDPLVALRAE